MHNCKTDEPWRVGVLFSRTGFNSVIEKTQLQGTVLAIEEINAAGGVHGRELLPVVYDPGSEAVAFGLLAKRLMIEDRVTTIFGCYTSASRKAVLPVVERLNGLLWYPTLYEGFEASTNVIYTGAAPNQNSLALGRYAMATFGKRVYFVGSDYVYPRESNRVMRDLLDRSGGSVVGERYVNMRAGRPDFLPILKDIRQISPDWIFSTVVGDGTAYLYQAYADAGLDPRITPIASLTTTEAEIGAMGFDVGEGHITAAPYFEGVTGEANASFVTRFKKRFGDECSTNMCIESAYFQIYLFAKALEEAESLDTDLLREMVLGNSFAAPQGQVRIDPLSGHTDVWTRIARVNRQGQFDILVESTAAIQADPFLIGCGCTMTGAES
jgi:ABC-type branched-subunit amino acid transport system substrate-binding protein